MASHARLSPSKADQWTVCPGAIPFIEANSGRLPQSASGESVAAVQGTLAHEYSENMIYSMCHPDEDARKSYRAKALDIRLKLQPQIIDNAEIYASWATQFVETQPDIPWGLELTAPLWYEPESGGTADFWAIVGDTLYVVDYKSGRLPVHVEGNLQITIYLSAIYDLVQKFNPQLRKFRAGVMQPFEHPGRREPVWWDLDLEMLQRYRSIIDAAVFEIRTPVSGQARLVASEKGCRFCPAKSLCPAQAEPIEAFAESLDEEPSALDEQYLFSIFGRLPQLRAFLDSVEDYVRDQEDDTLDRFSLQRKPGAKRRSWKDEEIVAKLLRDNGVDPYRKTMKTVAMLERELGDSAPKGLHELVEVDFNRPKIVSTTTPKPKFKVSR